MEIALLQNQLVIMIALQALLKKGDPVNVILENQIAFTQARLNALQY